MNEIKLLKDKKEIVLNALRHIDKDIIGQKKLTKEDKLFIEELKYAKDILLKKHQVNEETSHKHLELLTVLDRAL